MASLQVDHHTSGPNLIRLPAEVRNRILEYVFDDSRSLTGLSTTTRQQDDACPWLLLDSSYSARSALQVLLTCRQLYHDGQLLAWTRTHFVVKNPFLDIAARLATLQPRQVAAIRSLAFVADARQFRQLRLWAAHPFHSPALALDTLTIILHRSSFWHYLFDFTADLVALLRRLHGVRRLVVVRNGAQVKGSFKTWYNRLVALLLKTDHAERYAKDPPQLERTWWRWSFDDAAQSFTLEARPPKPLVHEQVYLEQILPLMEELRVSVENEDANLDPRAWNGS